MTRNRFACTLAVVLPVVAMMSTGTARGDAAESDATWFGLPAPDTTIALGIDYSRGEFDTDANTTITSVTPLVRLSWETVTIRASLPYFDIRGVLDPDSGGKIESENGVGDLTTSVSYTILPPRVWLPFLEFEVKLKLPTAKSGFGSEKVDVTFIADVTHQFGETLIVFADFGYRTRGGRRFHDTWLSSVGTGLLLANGWSVWLAYDWRESPINSDADRGIRNPGDEHELVPFMSVPFGEHLRVDPYFVIGLAAASPDWGIGTSLSWKF